MPACKLLYSGLNCAEPLVDEHRIPKGEEPIPILYCLRIGIHNMIPSGERRYQHHQCRLRQMEIRNQRIHHMELVARIDKDLRPAIAGMQHSIRRRCRLQRAAASCSDCDNPATILSCRIQSDLPSPDSRNNTLNAYGALPPHLPSPGGTFPDRREALLPQC